VTPRVSFDSIKGDWHNSAGSNTEMGSILDLSEWKMKDNGKLDREVKKGHDRPAPVQNDELGTELSFQNRE
jgi:hypothetical protein